MAGQRQKERRIVNRYLKKLNKSLREDCFAGRFVVELIGYKDYQCANYSIYTPELYTIDEVADPTWQYSYYRLRIVDVEEPERSFDCYAKWSSSLGLINTIAADEDSYRKGAKYIDNSGCRHFVWTVSNFIAESDFWQKWRSFDYAKNHWYSGKELKDYMRTLGPWWRSADTLKEHDPNRFK